MRTYIYTLKLFPRFQNKENWDEKDNEALEQHAKRLERQKKRGTVKFVGRTDLPIDNDENFGLVVFEAENDELAELFTQSDSAVMGKLMTATCFPFNHIY